MKDLYHDRRATGRGGEKVDASLSTLISIYLLILAFLITMHSVSSIELAKVGATMNAVQRAFNGYGSQSQNPIETYEVSAEDMANNFSVRSGAQPFYEEGAMLLQSALSMKGELSVREGQGLFIDVASNSIFIGVSDIIRPEFETFSAEMAKLIMVVGAREKREIEFVFGLGTGQEYISSQPLAEKRINSLARNLIDHGVAKENILFGVREGNAHKVTIGFHSRLSSGVELDFADLEGSVN